MDIYTIILPTYNDWKSLSILLGQIEKYFNKTNNTFKILVINDNSSEKNSYNLNKNKFFKEIRILNLRKNIGSQKAIATGLKYINKFYKKKDDKFIIMDSDGEDDPKKIKEIIQLVKKEKKTEIITMNRALRKESFFFSILYELHLLVTFIFTFKYIRFGNFSFLNRKVLKKIVNKKDLWFAYSATLKKYFKLNTFILAPRRKRISGKSKMSYLELINHSLNIQSIFKKNIFISYLLFLLIFGNFYLFDLSKLISLFIPFAIIIHFFIIFLNLKEKKNEVNFNLLLDNIKSIVKI